MLSVKPIITVTDGLVVMADKERSRAKARATVIASIAKAPDRAPLDPAHANQHARGGRGLPDATLAAIPGGVDAAKVTVGLIGASTGPHLGPDLMGASFLRARA